MVTLHTKKKFACPVHLLPPVPVRSTAARDVRPRRCPWRARARPLPHAGTARRRRQGHRSAAAFFYFLLRLCPSAPLLHLRGSLFPQESIISFPRFSVPIPASSISTAAHLSIHLLQSSIPHQIPLLYCRFDFLLPSYAWVQMQFTSALRTAAWAADIRARGRASSRRTHREPWRRPLRPCRKVSPCDRRTCTREGVVSEDPSGAVATGRCGQARRLGLATPLAASVVSLAGEAETRGSSRRASLHAVARQQRRALLTTPRKQSRRNSPPRRAASGPRASTVSCRLHCQQRCRQ